MATPNTATPSTRREIPPAVIIGAIVLVLAVVIGIGYKFLSPPQEMSREDAAAFKRQHMQNLQVTWVPCTHPSPLLSVAVDEHFQSGNGRRTLKRPPAVRLLGPLNQRLGVILGQQVSLRVSLLTIGLAKTAVLPPLCL